VRILLLSILISSVAWSQAGLIPGTTDPSKADIQMMTSNQSIISTTMRPLDGQADGFFVGNDEGTFDVHEFRSFLMGMHGKDKTQLKMQPAPSVPNLRYAVTKTKSRHKKKKLKQHLAYQKF
jgi:hypothetical protein